MKFDDLTREDQKRIEDFLLRLKKVEIKDQKIITLTFVKFVDNIFRGYYYTGRRWLKYPDEKVATEAN